MILTHTLTHTCVFLLRSTFCHNESIFSDPVSLLLGAANDPGYLRWPRYMGKALTAASTHSRLAYPHSDGAPLLPSVMKLSTLTPELPPHAGPLPSRQAPWASSWKNRPLVLLLRVFWVFFRIFHHRRKQAMLPHRKQENKYLLVS